MQVGRIGARCTEAALINARCILVASQFGIPQGLSSKLQWRFHKTGARTSSPEADAPRWNATQLEIGGARHAPVLACTRVATSKRPAGVGVARRGAAKCHGKRALRIALVAPPSGRVACGSRIEGCAPLRESALVDSDRALEFSGARSPYVSDSADECKRRRRCQPSFCHIGRERVRWYIPSCCVPCSVPFAARSCMHPPGSQSFAWLCPSPPVAFRS